MQTGIITINAAETAFAIDFDQPGINNNPEFEMRVDEYYVDADISYVGMIRHVRRTNKIEVRYLDGKTMIIDHIILSRGVHSNGDPVQFATIQDLRDFFHRYKFGQS